MERLTAEQLASALNCHPETIRRRAQRNEIPFVRLGKGPKAPYRFILDDVLAALPQGAAQ